MTVAAEGVTERELLREFNREQNLTIVMVTHEPHMAEYAGRRIHFFDGRIVTDPSSAGSPA